MTIKNMVGSRYFRVAAITCGVFLVALISFAAGVQVGSEKGLSSARFGEHYERNFLGGSDERGVLRMKTKGMMDKTLDKGMRNAHGTAGQILSIVGHTFVIKNQNNQESVVSVSEATIINRGRQTVTIGDLTVGTKIVVVGKPEDDGTIAAHLIRIFPNDNSR